MSIYTGRGDTGETDLRDRTRISKASPRIEAYGTVDELNALIGTALPTGHEDLDEHLQAIQNHLHIVQAQLADPGEAADTPHLGDEHIETLERWMDEADDELEPLQSFILPGGFESGSTLHHARAVCRRAERKTVALAEEAEEPLDRPRVYLNRLSDALFMFARVANHREGFEERNPTY